MSEVANGSRGGCGGIQAKTSGPDQREPSLVEAALTRGDQSCVDEVREMLADDEIGTFHRENNGSAAAWLRRTLIEKVGRGKHSRSERPLPKSSRRYKPSWRDPNPTPIERLLAERASLCWFIVNRYENAYANASGWTIAQADLQHRKIDKAHSRFLSALRTLAQVRKLALPTLQLNIAKNQVNLAGSQS